MCRGAYKVRLRGGSERVQQCNTSPPRCGKRLRGRVRRRRDRLPRASGAPLGPHVAHVRVLVALVQRNHLHRVRVSRTVFVAEGAGAAAHLVAQLCAQLAPHWGLGHLVVVADGERGRRRAQHAERVDLRKPEEGSAVFLVQAANQKALVRRGKQRAVSPRGGGPASTPGAAACTASVPAPRTGGPSASGRTRPRQ